MCESRSVVSDSLQLHGYTVHGILQARIVERIAFSFSILIDKVQIKSKYGTSKIIYLFIIFMIVLGLCCCVQAFSSCNARASNCSGFSLQSRGPRSSGFSSCGICA